MYTSVQRVAIQGEICKRTPFIITTVQQFILSKLEQTPQLSDGDMSTLLRAVKCSEAWLKLVCLSHPLTLSRTQIDPISKVYEINALSSFQKW